MTSPTPARVSGPGPYSQRTDNGQPLRDLPDARYGENRDFVAQQRAAPLANGPDRPTPPTGAPTPGPAGPPSGPMVPGPPPEIIPLSAPTTRPGEPVTAGAMNRDMARTRPELKPDQLSTALAPYFAADETGILADLAWQLAEMGL